MQPDMGLMLFSMLARTTVYCFHHKLDVVKHRCFGMSTSAARVISNSTYPEFKKLHKCEQECISRQNENHVVSVVVPKI